jgi:hypothetical protein
MFGGKVFEGDVELTSEDNEKWLFSLE